MSKRDPSRDPEMICHYISHAIAKVAHYEERESNKIECARKNLISQIERMYVEDSPHYTLSKRCLEHLNNSGTWKSPEDVRIFFKKYEELDLEIMTPIREADIKKTQADLLKRLSEED